MLFCFRLPLLPFALEFNRSKHRNLARKLLKSL
jgi:hypothetical protein